MANLKQDILNNLGNEKYYAEHELARLAQEPNMFYRGKVEQMSDLLKSLAEIDLATQLVGKYFNEPVPQEPAPAPEQPKAETPAPAPEQPKAHPGQSHAE